MLSSYIKVGRTNLQPRIILMWVLLVFQG